MRYRLLRPILLRLPPETAHTAATRVLGLAMSTSAMRSALRPTEADDARLATRVFEVDFPNPLGLAAGFDKSASSVNALGALGFGHIEVGTVTALPQPGNSRPRLFRLPADAALVNRMGFNNPGAAAVAERLAAKEVEPVLGINVGKSRAAAIEEAAADYVASIRALERHARYLVINVSSPNTPGLRTLQDPAPLRELLSAVDAAARSAAEARGGTAPPILLKIAPDLADDDVEVVGGLAAEAGIAGVVAVNTTIGRTGLRTPPDRVQAIGAGGLSGAPLAGRAGEVLGILRTSTSGRLPLVSVGGIDSAEEAWARIRAGASLVQLYTGLVYHGPGLVRSILRGLLRRVEREGLGSIGEAVGAAVPR